MRIKIIIILAGLIVLLVYGGNQVLFTLGLLALPGIMYYIIRSVMLVYRYGHFLPRLLVYIKPYLVSIPIY